VQGGERALHFLNRFIAFVSDMPTGDERKK